MNLKKVFYVFFTLMSLTTILGFIYEPSHISLFMATGINIISTVLHIGTRNLIAAESLASSLVADLHLVPGFIAYVVYGNLTLCMSLVIGAIAANIFSLALTLVASVKQDQSDENTY